MTMSAAELHESWPKRVFVDVFEFRVPRQSLLALESRDQLPLLDLRTVQYSSSTGH